MSIYTNFVLFTWYVLALSRSKDSFPTDVTMPTGSGQISRWLGLQRLRDSSKPCNSCELSQGRVFLIRRDSDRNTSQNAEMLTVHHLGISQSERILFLCEELSIEYSIVHHTRDPLAAPQSLKDVPGNATGKAPFIEDPESGITLQESGAICEYILAKHAAGQLDGRPHGKRLFKIFGEEAYPDYLYWLHWSNSTFQALLDRFTFFDIGQVPEDNVGYQWLTTSLHQTLALLDEHLVKNKWLAGQDFTAADIMTVFSLTTKRQFGPLVSYMKYPHILRYLENIGERPAYQRAMKKGDPEMKLFLGAEAPAQSLLQVGGVGSHTWKKTEESS